MSYEAEEHLTLLEQLLLNEPFEHNRQSTQNTGEYGHLHETQLESLQHDYATGIRETRADPGSEQRKGVPEIVFGETKNVAQIIGGAG